MKKILIALLLILGTLLFLFPRPILADTPPCDPSKVDLTERFLGIPFGTPGNSQSDCDNKFPGKNLIYCDATPVVGLLHGGPGCYKPGVTQRAVNCPQGSYLWPACSDPTGLTCSPQVCCTDPINPFNCMRAAYIVPRQDCGAYGYNWAFDKTSGKCVAMASSLWVLNAACDNGTAGVQTAIGCVPTGDLTGPNGFLSFLLKWVFGISGGIIVIMIIVTGYSILTSSGNPEKLAAAKENVVSIFSGLILIAFSLVLLQTIGGNILGLPGF